MRELVTEGETPEPKILVVDLDIDNLSVDEINTIEEHLGCPYHEARNRSTMGKIMEAHAFVHLRRLNPNVSDDELWDAAGTFRVRGKQQVEPNPTGRSGSGRRSPSQAGSRSPSKTSGA